MAFKHFKNLGLFMTVRHICCWQHQVTSRGWQAPKRLLMTLVSHLGMKLLLTRLLNAMPYDRHTGPPGNDCWTCVKVRWSFSVPVSWKSLLHILQDTEKKVTEELPIWGNCLWNVLLHENICQIVGANRLTMGATMLQKNLG